MRFLEGITINEARGRQTYLYSAAARTATQMAPIHPGIDRSHELFNNSLEVKEMKKKSMPQFQRINPN